MLSGVPVEKAFVDTIASHPTDSRGGASGGAIACYTNGADAPIIAHVSAFTAIL